jgi:hypothetical protein
MMRAGATKRLTLEWCLPLKSKSWKMGRAAILDLEAVLNGNTSNKPRRGTGLGNVMATYKVAVPLVKSCEGVFTEFAQTLSPAAKPRFWPPPTPGSHGR